MCWVFLVSTICLSEIVTFIHVPNLLCKFFLLTNFKTTFCPYLCNTSLAQWQSFSLIFTHLQFFMFHLCTFVLINVKCPREYIPKVSTKSPREFILKCPRKVIQLGDFSWTKMSTRCHQKCPREFTLKIYLRNVTHFEKKCPRNVIVHEMSPSHFFALWKVQVRIPGEDNI